MVVPRHPAPLRDELKQAEMRSGHDARPALYAGRVVQMRGVARQAGRAARNPARSLRSVGRHVRTELTIARNRRRAGAHQLSHATEYDRYPEIFRGVRSLCDLESPRILSFGCSDGQETATLAFYFEGAEIVGADISPQVLRRAATRCAELRNVSFVNTREEPLGNLEPFDVVFAMSVLCRHRDTREVDNSSDIYPFETFEASCGELAALVKCGGFLVVYNANYRFADTAPGAEFEPVELPGVTESGFVAKFDRNSARLTEQAYPDCVFRKSPRRRG